MGILGCVTYKLKGFTGSGVLEVGGSIWRGFHFAGLLRSSLGLYLRYHQDVYLSSDWAVYFRRRSPDQIGVRTLSTDLLLLKWGVAWTSKDAGHSWGFRVLL